VTDSVAVKVDDSRLPGHPVPDVSKMGDRGPLLVAVHGIQGTRAAWAPVAVQLAGAMRIVLPNLRGRGQAHRGRSRGDYGLDAYAGDLHEVIRREVGDQPFILAGWSMGVSVVLSYLQKPGVVRPNGLILLSGSPWLAGTHWFEGRGSALLDNIAQRERRLGLRDVADRDAVAWTWEAIRRSDQRHQLARIEIPTLVLHGSDDEDCPWAHGALLAEGIHAVEFSTVVGAGHSLLSRNTATVVDAMRRFVERLSQCSVTAP
jgi:pimeloyl-ACP methyl ester carboxylesterase